MIYIYIGKTNYLKSSVKNCLCQGNKFDPEEREVAIHEGFLGSMAESLALRGFLLDTPVSPHHQNLPISIIFQVDI